MSQKLDWRKARHSKPTLNISDEKDRYETDRAARWLERRALNAAKWAKHHRRKRK